MAEGSLLAEVRCLRVQVEEQREEIRILKSRLGETEKSVSLTLRREEEGQGEWRVVRTRRAGKTPACSPPVPETRNSFSVLRDEC